MGSKLAVKLVAAQLLVFGGLFLVVAGMLLAYEAGRRSGDVSAALGLLVFAPAGAASETLGGPRVWRLASKLALPLSGAFLLEVLARLAPFLVVWVIGAQRTGGLWLVAAVVVWAGLRTEMTRRLVVFDAPPDWRLFGLSIVFLAIGIFLSGMPLLLGGP